MSSILVATLAVAALTGNDEDSLRPRTAIVLRLFQEAQAEDLAGILDWLESETALDVRVLPLLSKDDACTKNDVCLLERVVTQEFDLMMVIDHGAWREKENYRSSITVASYILPEHVPFSTQVMTDWENKIIAALPSLVPEAYLQPARLTLSGPDRLLATLGTDRCLVPCSMTRLPPGTHELRLEREGKVASQGIELRPGQELRLDLSIPEPSSLWASPWLWTAVGVVVASAAVGSAIALSASSGISQ